MVEKRDRIRGCLLGGAAGDALGYPVEFMTYEEILKSRGADGICDYSLDFEEGLALVSDDTQMTLFTANGILLGETENKLSGENKPIQAYVYKAYIDWLATQTGNKQLEKPETWLYDIPELHVRRAPGTTCLNALIAGKMGCIEKPINNSKGCGGVVRAAPAGLCGLNHMESAKLGAEIAAITHGHPLGYIPAAVLAYTVHAAAYRDEASVVTLKSIVLDAVNVVSGIFAEAVYLPKLRELIDKAVSLSENSRTDIENIQTLGEGWIAEETLAIAVYCSLRYCGDFSNGIIAAVNHSGDSDSTGAVTGNILGAWLGYNKIEEKWKRNLELKRTLLEIADDLCDGCCTEDEKWIRKYGERAYKI
ncbi:MAG: ADP-ribosylglycohydrolase family protein [Candidatus Ornithomonoglobus sp.]